LGKDVLKLEGVITALITPFLPDGSIDFPALRRLVETQIECGVGGLVACGTTAETPALSHSEYDQVIKTVVDVVGGRVPVLVGTGTYNTQDTIDKTARAAELGADAALVVTPYYSKPQQQGMKDHFRAVVANGGLPVVIYNIPGRSVVNLLPAAIIELAQDPRFIGVKEAAGSVTQLRDIVCGVSPDFAVLGGDDGLCLPFYSVGACGLVSVASNVACSQMVRLWNLWKSGDAKGAAELDRRLTPLYAALFIETSPAPCKALAEHLGICSSLVRTPLSQATEATRKAVVDAYKLL
jgi:4-hydroxy-tetrahydrodipicolinate synthase